MRISTANFAYWECSIVIVIVIWNRLECKTKCWWNNQPWSSLILWKVNKNYWRTCLFWSNVLIQDDAVSIKPSVKNCPGRETIWLNNNRFASMEAKNQVFLYFLCFKLHLVSLWLTLATLPHSSQACVTMWAILLLLKSCHLWNRNIKDSDYYEHTQICIMILMIAFKVTIRNLKNENVNFAGFSPGFLVAKAKREEHNIPKVGRTIQKMGIFFVFTI